MHPRTEQSRGPQTSHVCAVSKQRWGNGSSTCGGVNLDPASPSTHKTSSGDQRPKFQSWNCKTQKYIFMIPDEEMTRGDKKWENTRGAGLSQN